MKHHHTHPTAPLLTALAAALLLAACGGDTQDLEATAPDVTPLFELAATLPPEPSDIDADGSAASAALPPGRATLLDAPAAGAAPDNADTLRRRILAAAMDGDRASANASATAAATATYYTVAQVRAAYGLDKLPAATAANKGAYQGSGQTIAIVGAFHNPNIANDLQVFSTKFGLPTCTTLTVAATASLPLAKPAAGSGCSLAVVHATAAGGITTRAPAVNAAWKTETSLDVEWAHAMAPLARIILVQAASAGSADLTGALTLAARLGATVVNMSWGAGEFSGQGSLDRYFQAAGVSYIAASGDSGRAVSWPAVSPHVLAVGGTTLAVATSTSGNTRSETAWAGSGGGISLYNTVPAWQGGVKVTSTSGAVGTATKRVLPDVAFNANPSSGQLVYVTPASGSNGWLVAGGTSIGAPQWAGLVAVANAVRAGRGKPALGALGTPLYRSIAANANLYAANLLDVKTGANGSCKGCSATTGFDLVTGLGTPHAAKLVDVLAGL